MLYSITKRKINKIVTLLFLLGLLVIVAACGNNENTNGNESDSKDDPVKIEFAHFDGTDKTQDAVNDFNEMQDDIEVNFTQLQPTPTERFNKFSTLFNSKSETPDVILIDVTWPAMFASAGWIAPIDSYIDDEYLERFFPFAVDVAEVDGKHYGIQQEVDVGMFYYREDLLEKHDLKVPETWDEMIETTNKVRDKEGNNGLDGFIFQGDQIEGATINFLEVLWGLGGDIEVDENEINVDTPMAEEALTLMQDLIYKDKVSPVSVATSNPNDNVNVYGNGEVLFMRNLPFAKTPLKDSKVDGKFGVAPLLHKEGEESHSVTGGWIPVINNFSENKDEAWEFIEYLLSDEEQLSLAIESSRLPSVKSIYDTDEALKAQPFMEELPQFLEDARSRPTLVGYEEFSRILQKEINLVLNGEKEPGTAIKDAQESIDNKINNK